MDAHQIAAAAAVDVDERQVGCFFQIDQQLFLVPKGWVPPTRKPVWRLATSGRQGSTTFCSRSAAPGSWRNLAVAVHEDDQGPRRLVLETRVLTTACSSTLSSRAETWCRRVPRRRTDGWNKAPGGL